MTAGAVAAPAWAGPEDLPCARRTTLHCRCATRRAGRPRLRQCPHLLQGALGVEPASTLAVWVGAAGERGLPGFFFGQVKPHRALADGVPGLLEGLALPGIFWFIGAEAAEVSACSADEECAVGPGALAQEALTGILVTGHTGELLLPLSCQLG